MAVRGDELKIQNLNATFFFQVEVQGVLRAKEVRSICLDATLIIITNHHLNVSNDDVDISSTCCRFALATQIIITNHHPHVSNDDVRFSDRG